MIIDAQIITDFRTAYPEFADDVKWLDDALGRALCDADTETGGSCWGGYDGSDCHNFKANGMFLYAGAWLVTVYPQGADNLANVVIGQKSPQTGKSVGDESVSYASPDYSKLGVGDMWLTTNFYGQQWLRLRRRAGMGARAV